MQIHIQRKRDYVHVSRALAVSEKSSLYSVRARKQTELSIGDRAAPVVVRVQRHYNILPVVESFAHILYLLCVDV